MGAFVDQLLGRAPAGIAVPDELRHLVHWVEDNGWFELGRVGVGELYGGLQPGSGLGTWIALHAATPEEEAANARAWAGDAAGAELLTARVWPFARCFDGSQIALWRADDGASRIVHIGSGSGSMLTSTLGERPVDFLRLLAIGYDQICWPEEWDSPPAGPVNQPLRDWVTTTFGVTIPTIGSEIVPRPADMSDTTTDDPFLGWLLSTGLL